MNPFRANLYLLVGFLIILLFFVTSSVVHAVPAAFDWGSFDSGGSTSYGVYNTDNTTVLPTGSLVQFIWAGEDGLVEPPTCGGSPGGDDQLLAISLINNGSPLPPPLQNKGYVTFNTYSFDTEDPQQGGLVYMRAWNAGSVPEATAYGDSATAMLNNGSVLNAPRFYTNSSFITTNWNGADGGNWDDDSNWSTGLSPDVGTTVSIPSGRAVLSSNVAIRCLQISSGAIVDLGTFDLAVEDTIVNQGTLRQTKTVNGAAIDFLHIMDEDGSNVKYRGVTVDSTSNLGVVTVAIKGIDPAAGEYCTSTGPSSPPYAARCFQIVATVNGGATVTLWSLATELQDIDPNNLALYRFDSGSWEQLIVNATTGNDGSDYVFARADTPGFSDFLVAETNNSPTAVRLNKLSARSTDATLPNVFFVLTSIFFGFMTMWAYRRKP